MQSAHIPASPRSWHESGQSISIDGQYNTGVCFPPGQSTKVEHPSPDQDPIKIRRTTSEAFNTATPTTSVNQPIQPPKSKTEEIKGCGQYRQHNSTYQRAPQCSMYGSSRDHPRTPSSPRGAGLTFAHNSTRCGTPHRATSAARMQDTRPSP